MEFRQLRYFEKVAALKSFSKAAIYLHVAQPALSRQVRLLEEELNVKLFTRVGRGISPTEAGTKLATRATFLLRFLDQVREEVTALSNVVAGHVMLGSIPSVSEILMAKIVADFADQYPNAKLSLRESVSPSVREWLLEGKVDCAVYCQSERRAGIIEIPLIEEEICFLCSPKFAKPFSVIELADLAQMPLIMPSSINAIRQCLDEILMTQGLTPKISIEIDGLGAIRRLLRDGRGGTVMPHSACRHELASGELFAARINDPRMTRTLVFAHMADRPMSRVGAQLFKLVETEVAALVRQGEWAGTIP